jgi:hypothetical protein
MKKIGFIGLLFCMSIAANAQKISNKGLAHKILQDSRLDTIQSRALNLLSGFTAGTSYGEVWIRDFNTFINGSLQIHKKEKVKDLLLAFFRFQGKDGNIVDGYIPDEKADKSYMPDRFIYSNLMPGYAAHKNTVETDQESSLIQAIGKYIDYTSDTSILDETVNGISVLKRMEMAMNFILTKRWSPKHGLVIGATTVDWGMYNPIQAVLVWRSIRKRNGRSTYMTMRCFTWQSTILSAWHPKVTGRKIIGLPSQRNLNAIPVLIYGVRISRSTFRIFI